MAGYPVNASIVNQRAGPLVEQGRNWADQILTFKAYLDRFPTAAAMVEEIPDLSAEDADAIRGAITDLANGVAVLRGQRAQPGASDFFYNAKTLTGIQ